MALCPRLDERVELRRVVLEVTRVTLLGVRFCRLAVVLERLLPLDLRLLTLRVGVSSSTSSSSTLST